MHSDSPAIPLRCDAKLLRDVVHATTLHALGPRLLLATGFLGIPFALAYERGERSWLVYLFGLAFLGVVLYCWATYRRRLRAALAPLESAADADATLHLGVAALTHASPAGTRHIGWSEVRELWQHRAWWLLRFKDRPDLALPLHALDDAARALLIARLRGAGVRV